MTNLYQSDPRTLSDAELETLSAELEQEYRLSGSEEDFWTDDAAEERYYQLHREIRRRWELAHPDWKPLPLNEYVKIALAALSKQFDASVVRAFNPEFAGKIGDTIEVRRPARFQA